MLELNYSRVRHFHDVAWQHHDAATYLLNGCHPNSSSGRASEAVYLGGYVVECILKALLLSHTRQKDHKALEEEFISEIRHDLEELKARLERLKKNPIAFPDVEARAFRLVRRQWSSAMRYHGRMTKTTDAREFLEAAQVLLDWICGG